MNELPFPLPEVVQEKLDHTLFGAAPSPLNPFCNGGRPAHVGCVEEWYTKANSHFRGLKMLWEEYERAPSPQRMFEMSEAVWACFSAVEAEFNRLGRMLPFLEHSWPHDPVIKAHFDG